MAQQLSKDDLRCVRYAVISAALLWFQQQEEYRQERSPSVSSQKTQADSSDEDDEELRCHEVLGDQSHSHPEREFIFTCDACGILTMWSSKLPSEFPFGNCLSDECLTRVFNEQAKKHNFKLE